MCNPLSTSEAGCVLRYVFEVVTFPSKQVVKAAIKRPTIWIRKDIWINNRGWHYTLHSTPYSVQGQCPLVEGTATYHGSESLHSHSAIIIRVMFRPAVVSKLFYEPVYLIVTRYAMYTIVRMYSAASSQSGPRTKRAHAKKVRPINHPSYV